eukprot:TRINITY_DN65216_c0_g1_i1.p1 TRINITY_DN65216_c0_g1~~TRINITY_DN65216_c0_g1_i1.p1  ORF type:complete len:554 (+),score=247.12 TRINITY_DN65216_c0_g1_i1:133-1662(+)
MVSWWLVLIAIIGVILTMGVAAYIVVLYSSLEDRNQAWFPKVVVLLGLTLAGFTVLLLPYDVANRQNPEIMDDQGGGINTAVCWQVVLWSIVIMVLFVTPFTTFYYEAWDPAIEGAESVKLQLRSAFMYTFVVCFLFFLMFIILWFTAGEAELNYHYYASPPQNMDLRDTRDPFQPAAGGIPCFCDHKGAACYTRQQSFESTCGSGSGDLSIKVSAFVYMVGLMCAFGWIFFIAFGGVGLLALPVDLINDWRMRPKKMTRLEFADARKEMAQKIADMVEWGKSLEDKEDRGEKGWFGSTRKAVNKYKSDVVQLEEEWERLKESDPAHDKDRKILKAWLKLPVGIVGTVISLMWVVHIIVHNLADSHPLLNNLFSGLDGFFPVFGVIAYALFAMWLLWAAVKGCFKLGLNFGIIAIHPMKPNGTLMSSFLFNTMIILLMSVVVTQFAALSFRMYAANTVVDGIFTTYVTHLKGIGYIMQYFQIAMLVFIGLAAVWLLFKPWCCPDKQGRD